MKQIIIYGVIYNPMIHESVSGVVSLFLNQKDAEMALEYEKKEFYKEEGREPTDYERWNVAEYELNAEDSIIKFLNSSK